LRFGWPLLLALSACVWVGGADETSRLDPDGDGVSWPDDCDDDDASVLGPTTWHADGDGDGYGAIAYTTLACTRPAGFVADDRDCNDSSSDIHPDAPEVCNGRDDDCDEAIDDADDDVSGSVSWYFDADGDGWGTGKPTEPSCDAPKGYASEYEDCNDQDPSISPGMPEGCNGQDDDCDGVIDESDAIDAPYWYRDGDGDGYGTSIGPKNSCTQLEGYVAQDGDCDDGESTTNPNAFERCDTYDNDCDGVVDEAGAIDALSYCRDADDDLHGDPENAYTGCSRLSGYIHECTDCDDESDDVSPDAVETCNGIDDDCDGDVDEADATDTTSFYADVDDDGYGDPAVSLQSCTTPDGYVADDRDCDDANSAIHPGVTDPVGDTVDQNCDGAIVLIEEHFGGPATPWPAALDCDLSSGEDAGWECCDDVCDASLAEPPTPSSDSSPDAAAFLAEGGNEIGQVSRGFGGLFSLDFLFLESAGGDWSLRAGSNLTDPVIEVGAQGTTWYAGTETIGTRSADWHLMSLVVDPTEGILVASVDHGDLTTTSFTGSITTLWFRDDGAGLYLDGVYAEIIAD
jgi:hypothetical protein